MPRQLSRAANRPILIRRINLWWYAAALPAILALGWLALADLLPGIVLPLVLFGLIFWLASFVMAVIGKLRGPQADKSAPEPRQ
jgi:hypothetical protein